ncbi:hypothetical protein TBLA_0D04230 [Henningerozyma blattae CBS 6284]|uniref:Uncharacterized protein n=1 Tax=Henningerozyma blattae (strain ATCC 34711 / CBS 6284 / DSM 70876 / NBRC 10599 / NRRL Y-10934 / UCD 77-7) TaxID=1071380 RepID=I2H3G8_HENB6|nr:hypothetical protein TBLA_0D04230 [Tetrapisispora blattae CBS 6284]CCH60920.1 hypothetical protein TBLA_0D04230 [Tetrapisispora blattae CBS 6284]
MNPLSTTSTVLFPTETIGKDVEYFLTNALHYIIQVLQIMIPMIISFSRNYPTLFLVCTGIIFVYVIFSIICRIFTILKRLLFVALILMGFFIYARGSDQFINYDLPYLKKLIFQDENVYDVLIKWLYYLKNTTYDHSTAFYKFVTTTIRAVNNHPVNQ